MNPAIYLCAVEHECHHHHSLEFWLLLIVGIALVLAASFYAIWRYTRV